MTCLLQLVGYTPVNVVNHVHTTKSRSWIHKTKLIKWCTYILKIIGLRNEHWILQKIIDLRVTFWKNCTWALNHCMHTDRCSSLKNSNISLLYLSLTNCSPSKLFNLSLQINNSKKSISLTKTIKQRKIWYKGSQLWAILFNRSSLLIILCRNKVWVVAILIGPNSLRIYCIRPKCGLLWF